MSVLAVGTVAFDDIETPFGQEKGVLGGSAMYICMAARFLTPNARLVAVVGNDFPKAYVDVMEDAGVDLRGLDMDPDGKTFTWGGRYHYDLNDRDTLYTELNVLSGFDPELPEAYLDSRVVCLGNLDPSIQHRVLDQTPDAAFTVLDTMNYWIERTPESLRTVLSRVDCLVVNDAEARELADHPNLIRAARLIRDLGPEILVIKKGEHGALLFIDDTVFSVPAYPLENIQDPTGAGDAFMGGFAGYLSSQPEVTLDALKQALVFGSAIGSFCVEEFGPARLVDLTVPDLERRMDAFRDLTTIPERSAVSASTG